MSDKKNIDRLFQEKFKDFEAEPNKQIWLNIEAELQKKNRKTIPIWIKFSGIAAAFILGLFTLNMAFNTNTDNLKTVVLDSKIPNENKKSNPHQKKDSSPVIHIKNDLNIVIANPKTLRNHGKENKTITSSKPNQVQTKSQTNTKLYFQKNNSSISSIVSNNNNLISDVNVNTEDSLESSHSPIINSDGVATQFKLEKKTATQVLESTLEKQAESIAETSNDLAEILKSKQDGKLKVEPISREKWQIVPHIAAVYLNSNSSGSAIDRNFSDNQKSDDSGLSFGLGVNYVVSDKITLRTGVNRLALGYNTHDVKFSPGLVTNNLANIDYSSNVPIEIKNNDAASASTSSDNAYSNNGVINQKMGYYEVPLELSYAVLNKKFGINLIGGISTLFLNQNKTSLVSSEFNQKLGEANNLNQIHFSTNVGMGFKYEFIKSFEINIEPMVKFQLNTYTNNSSDYKPVFMGVYSGLIYNF